MKKVKKCRRCGKPLKTPKSQELGFGPTCYKKYLAEKDNRKALFSLTGGKA